MNRVGPGLWVCDIATVRERPTDRFDRIVTVCQDSVAANVSPATAYHHVALSDGPPEGHVPGACDRETVARAIDHVVAGLESGDETLVHCHAGRSRSPTIAAAALAIHTDQDFDDALYAVTQTNGPTFPHPMILDFARDVVDESRSTLK